MKVIELSNLEESNLIDKNASLAVSDAILGMDDLPTKVSIMLEGKVLEIIPAFTDYNPRRKKNLWNNPMRASGWM